MSETKHTTGKWLNAGRSAGAHIHADDGEIAWLRSYMGIADEQIDANACLIAAAPDLLQALKDCLGRFVEAFPAAEEYEPIKRGFAAIRKAEGSLT